MEMLQHHETTTEWSLHRFSSLKQLEVGVGGVFGEDYLRIDASHTLEAGSASYAICGSNFF